MMTMVKTLTALSFSAALVPALTLGTVAFADEQRGMQSGQQEQRSMQSDQQKQRGMQGDQQHQRRMQGGQQGQGGVQGGVQDSVQGDQQRAGEQFMSGKPSGAFYADDVIGKTVKHRASDDDVGEIQDLVIGEDGRILGVVITSGGFLGLGGQDVGLGWDHIEHTMEDGESVFYTDMDEDTLKNAPEYERD